MSRSNVGSQGGSYSGKNDKKKNKRKENPNNIFNLKFTKPEHEERYNLLFNRIIAPTKFVHVPTLIALEMRDQVFKLFTNCGLNRFFKLHAPTYARITLEFLCSVEVFAEPIEGRYITFRLMDVDHRLTLDEFGEAFGFFRDGFTFIQSEFNVHQTCQRMCYQKAENSEAQTQVVFDSSGTKATLIYNPALRYAQKSLAHSIFSRGDSAGSVREIEFFALDCMLRGRKLDGAYLFAKQLEKIGSKKSGEINIGGFITILATYLEYDLSGFPIMHEEKYLDLLYLVNSHMLRNQRGTYLYLQGKRNLVQFTLPNQERTNPFVESNLQPSALYPPQSSSTQPGSSRRASEQTTPVIVIPEEVQSSEFSHFQHQAQSQAQQQHQPDLNERVTNLERNQQLMQRTMETGFSSITELLNQYFENQGKGASGSGT